MNLIFQFPTGFSRDRCGMGHPSEGSLLSIPYRILTAIMCMEALHGVIFIFQFPTGFSHTASKVLI